MLWIVDPRRSRRFARILSRILAKTAASLIAVAVVTGAAWMAAPLHAQSDVSQPRANEFPPRVRVLRPANLRGGPGTAFAIVGGARTGDEFNVVGCNPACDWYELEGGGWIAAFLVEPVEASPAPTTTPEASLPDGTTSDPLAEGAAPRETITRTDTVTATGSITATSVPTVPADISETAPITASDNAPPSADGVPTPRGRLASLPTPAPPLPTANRDANLRAGPGTNHRILGQVTAGEPLRIVATNAAGDWYFLAGGEWIAAFLVDNGPVGLPDAADPYTLPRPPVGSVWSEAEFAYVNELQAMLDDFFDALESFESQAALLDDDETLIFDRNWRTVFFASANRVTETVTDLRILGPPPRFALSHAHILSASLHFEASMAAVIQGTRSLSNALIDEAVAEMEAGVDALDLAYRFMRRLEGVEVQ